MNLSGFARYNGFVWFSVKRQWGIAWNVSVLHDITDLYGLAWNDNGGIAWNVSGFARYNGFVWFSVKRKWGIAWNLSGYARKLVEKTANGFVW